MMIYLFVVLEGLRNEISSEVDNLNALLHGSH